MPNMLRPTYAFNEPFHTADIATMSNYAAQAARQMRGEQTKAKPAEVQGNLTAWRKSAFKALREPNGLSHFRMQIEGGLLNGIETTKQQVLRVINTVGIAQQTALFGATRVPTNTELEKACSFDLVDDTESPVKVLASIDPALNIPGEAAIRIYTVPEELLEDSVEYALNKDTLLDLLKEINNQKEVAIDIMDFSTNTPEFFARLCYIFGVNEEQAFPAYDDVREHISGVITKTRDSIFISDNEHYARVRTLFNFLKGYQDLQRLRKAFPDSTPKVVYVPTMDGPNVEKHWQKLKEVSVMLNNEQVR